MSDEQKVSLGSKIILEIILVIVSILFSIRLCGLNKTILEQKITNPFEVLKFNNNQPIHFFVYAVLIIGAAVFLTWWFMVTSSDENVNRYFFCLSIVSFIINLAIVIITIRLIYNPILQAILTVSAVGFAVIAAGESDF